MCGAEYRPSHRVTKFCSLKCCWKKQTTNHPSKWAARKRAQRAIPLVKCEECGSTNNLQRHHDDLSRPLDVKVLCQQCHTNRDMELGKWGRRPVLTAFAPVAMASSPPKPPTPSDSCSQGEGCEQ